MENAPQPTNGNRKRRYRGKVDKPKSALNQKQRQSLKTRNLILDCAEELFARRGLYGVTVRNIAESAKVDTALIHYYFGPKSDVFEAVFDRRSDTVNKARMESMQTYESLAGGDITVEGAIQAFLKPIFDNDRQNDSGWQNYSSLVAMANNSQEWGGAMMSRYFDKVIHKLIDLLRIAMPGADDQDLYWAYHMFSGSLMVIQANTGRIELLSGEKCQSGDVDAFGERLIAYTAAGFKTICKTS